MCTLLIARNLFRFYPLVVATNRDERLLRPSSGPKLWGGAPKMLAPVDDVFGGTWIGVNEYGVLAAVTNRLSIPHESGQLLSRGMLIPAALEGRTAMEGLKRILDINGEMLNGFHLAIVDHTDGWFALGDGKEITARPMPDGLSVVTEQGWEPEHSHRARRIEALFRRETSRHPPTRAGLSIPLSLHDHPFSEPGEMGTCLHGAPDDEWVTKSSSFIRAQERDGRTWWDYGHRERTETSHTCETRWSSHELDIIK